MLTLDNSIRRVIAYFSLFDYPLTTFEVHKYLWQPDKHYSLLEVENELQYLVDNKILVFSEGFYFSKKQENNKTIKQVRKQRYLLAQEKIKKARKYIWLISKMPYVRGIFICNNLGYLNAPEDADIDLAIITEKNKIWTARFFPTLILKILNKRPTEKTQQDKICLSFYITKDNLNLRSLAYKNDVHFVHWVNQFMPIFGEPKLINDFFEANNWTKSFLPNYFPIKTNERWKISSKPYFKKIIELIIRPKIGESLLKKFQLKVMPSHLKRIAREANTNVVICDEILKFHDKDNRKVINELCK